MSFVLFALFQSLLFTSVLSQGTCKETSSVELTFYGFVDGMSDQTSFSCGSGNKAGGIGTYSNPETFATAQSNTNFKNCDIVYIPYLRKYFQYTDHCQRCDQDYSSSGLTKLDLWIGNSVNGGQAQILCEETFGLVTGQTIIQNPPSDLPVSSGALWDGSTCHDAKSQSPLVYPNPSTSGLCAGGSSSGGDSSSSPAPIASTGPTSTPVPQPPVVSSPSSAPPQAPPSQAPVVSSITQSPPPTTLLTVTATATSSTITATSTANAVERLAKAPSDQSSSASGAGGQIGDPCESYGDCAGNWICMGMPKTCHDNMKD
ncbi:hypothetical protein ACLMJK_001431 [Lecanora helva]